MRKIFALLTIVCAASAMAANAPAWYCDFEEGEGYQPGDVIGQPASAASANRWQMRYKTPLNRNVVSNDSTFATSGSQFLSFNPSVSHAGYAIVRFDISSEYEAVSNGKILVSWDMRRTDATYSADVGTFILYNFGSSGKTYEIEICRFALNWGYSDFTASNSDKTGTTYVRTNMPGSGGVWHHCTVLLDPPNRMIDEVTLDGVKITDCTGMYYKNECDGKTRGGDLIDGVGVLRRLLVDNVKVEVIPEPGFFGLLAFLGLLFARKQR